MMDQEMCLTEIEWFNLLHHLMSADNDCRSVYEKQFQTLRESEPNGTLSALLHILNASHANANVQTLAAILLRRTLVSNNCSIWSNLSKTMQETLKTQLLELLVHQQNPIVRRRISEMIGDIALPLLERDEWDSLLPTICKWHETQDMNLRSSCLQILHKIMPYSADFIRMEQTEEGSNSPVDKEEKGVERQLLWIIESALTTDKDERHEHIAVDAVQMFTTLTVEVDALNAECGIWQCSVRREKFQRIMSRILSVMQHMLGTNNFQSLYKIVEIWIDALDSTDNDLESSIIRHVMKHCLMSMTELLIVLADTSSLEQAAIPNNLRHVALELLVTIAEKAPSICCKIGRDKQRQFFSVRVFPVAFKMMLLLNDVDAWSAKSFDDEEKWSEITGITDFDVGSEALERLAQALGPCHALPICFKLIRSYGADTCNWMSRHAALVGMYQIVELFSYQHLDGVVEQLFSSLKDPHERVCCTALDVIGQLSIAQGPFFQEKYHKRVFQILSKYLYDFQRPRLQAHAAIALRKFIDLCEESILKLYMDELVHALLHLLQHGQEEMMKADIHLPATYQAVQEQFLSVISSIATGAQKAFSKCSGKTMYCLEKVLRECLTTVRATRASNGSSVKLKGLFSLAGVALECISLCALAIGKQTFQQDAVNSIQLMVEMQQDVEISNNEWIRIYLLQAWGRCCKCLEKDFAVCLPIVMPSLFHFASQQAEVKLDDNSLALEEHGSDDIEIAQVNDQCVTVYTSVLEEKAIACQLLSEMVDTLEEVYFPYVEQTTQLLAPLATDSVHVDIRSAAIHAFPALLKSVIAGSALNSVSDPIHTTQIVKQMFDFVMGRLLDTLLSEPDTDLVIDIMQSIKACLLCIESHAEKIHSERLQASTLLNLAQQRELVQGLLSVLADSIQCRAYRRAERELMSDDEQDHTNNKDEIDTSTEEQQEEERVHFGMADCLGQLAKTHPKTFFNVFRDLLWDKLHELCSSQCLPQDRKLALYIIDDVLEFCDSESLLPELSSFVILFLDTIKTHHEHAPVLQAASYGIGLCAAISGKSNTNDMPYLSRTLELLFQNLHLYSKSKRTAMHNAIDNVVSAIGIILQYNRKSLEYDKAMSLDLEWLSRLPLLGDIEESIAVLHRLCDMLRDGFFNYCGPNDLHQILSRILKIFAKVIRQKDRFLETVSADDLDKIFDRFRDILAEWRRQIFMDEKYLNFVWNALDKADQMALQTLF